MTVPDAAKAMTGRHIPVLLHESIDGLELRAGETFLDGTLGGGGHSTRVLEQFPGVRVIATDQDPGASAKFADSQFEVYRENFRNLDKVLEQAGVREVDAILLDLGISSDQLETSGRGFSFQKDEPLDMRMSGEGITAADILNNFDEATLELIIRGFGEEQYSRKIARAIVEARESKPFETTLDLVATVSGAVPTGYKKGRINPATRTFQALRIAVNEELQALEEGLEKGFTALKSSGRLAVVSFHSLEDRIVKNFFRNKAKEGLATLITKKPITPSEEEISRNPRSRSAKLRIIEKI